MTIYIFTFYIVFGNVCREILESSQKAEATEYCTWLFSTDTWDATPIVDSGQYCTPRVNRSFPGWTDELQRPNISFCELIHLIKLRESQFAGATDHTTSTNPITESITTTKATRDDAISTDLIISTRPDFYQNMISWRAMNEAKREISFILVKELALW